jgi:hypothetical protein
MAGVRVSKGRGTHATPWDIGVTKFVTWAFFVVVVHGVRHLHHAVPAVPVAGVVDAGALPEGGHVSVLAPRRKGALPATAVLRQAGGVERLGVQNVAWTRVLLVNAGLMDEVLFVLGIILGSRIVRVVESVVHHDHLPYFVLEGPLFVLLWRDQLPQLRRNEGVDVAARPHAGAPGPE